MVWIGVATIENDAMDILKNYVAPMKLLILETFVGTKHFMMASILVGFIFISPPPIT